MLDHSLFRLRNGKALPLGDLLTCLRERMSVRRELFSLTTEIQTYLRLGTT